MNGRFACRGPPVPCSTVRRLDVKHDKETEHNDG